MLHSSSRWTRGRVLHAFTRQEVFKELNLLVAGARLLVAQLAGVVAANPLWKLCQRASNLVGEVFACQPLDAERGFDLDPHILSCRLLGGLWRHGSQVATCLES